MDGVENPEKCSICVFVIIFAVANEESVTETEPRAKVTGKFMNVSLNICHMEYFKSISH